MNVSRNTVSALQNVSDSHGILELLQIENESFSAPIRMVNDTRDWTINGINWIAFPFRLKLPNQLQKESPRARLQIDNVGRLPIALIEGIPVGSTVMATIRLVSRSTPSVIDYEFVAQLSNIQATQTILSADMGPDSTMRKSAVQLRFDTKHAPGLFAG